MEEEKKDKIMIRKKRRTKDNRFCKKRNWKKTATI